MSSRLTVFATVVFFSALSLSVTAEAADRAKELDPVKIDEPTTKPLVIFMGATNGVSGQLQQTIPDGVLSPEAFCVGRWQGSELHYFPNWFIGGEQYAVYQDPTETGCIVTYPFDITFVVFQLFAQAPTEIEIQPVIYDYIGPDVIGPALYTGSPSIESLYYPGYWSFFIPITHTVSGPYYAGVNIITNPGTGVADILVDDGTTVLPRSDACYNNRGGGWQDLVDDVGFTENLDLHSAGRTQFGGGCQTSNCVYIPDLTVKAGQQDVEIPILISNESELFSIELPLTVETVQGSASITSARMEYRERLTTALTDIRLAGLYDLEDGTCKDGQPGGYGTKSASGWDTDFPTGPMPEGVEFFAMDLTNHFLPAGSDGIGSWVLVVDIGPGMGAMIVDTTCTDGGGHPVFLPLVGPNITPEFSGAVITVEGCCGMYDPDNRTGNVDQDVGNVKDLTDILMLASWAFLSGDDPPCFADMNTNGDVGCVYDLGDVLTLASYAYLGGGLPAYCLPECE